MEGGKQGRFKKFGAAIKKAAEDAQVASATRENDNRNSYGKLVRSAQFGTNTVEIYERGYVRVGMFLTAKSQFEKLQSIKFTTQVQDKSAGGRAAMGVMTGGLNYLGSKEKRVVFLTIATDRKMHTLQAEGGMTRSEDKAGMALEAAGNAVLGIMKDATPAQVNVVNQPPPPAAQPDILDQIKKLADLHAAGVLTDEEFAAKKADLLDRM